MPANPNKMNSAVIYARYSSHNQGEQSIEGQLTDCYEFAAREGLCVVGEYVDRAKSGRKTTHRDEFNRMIADAQKKQFSYVIVWKLDRFARNRYDSATFKSKLKRYGVKVLSAKENISDNPEGIILEGLLESMAEYYSANLAQNIRRGQKETIAKGLFCGGTIPFGYKLVNQKLVADERKAPFVRYFFEEYAKGISKKDIIQELNNRGARTPQGKLLTHKNLQRVLNNPTYIGHYHWRGEEIVGCAEALIDEELFDTVQNRLSATRRAPAARKARTPYLLRGKLFCGHCGESMNGESGTGRHGVVHHYYKCNGRKHKHNCNKNNEKKGFLEWYIVEQTCEYILSPERIHTVAQSVVAQYDKEFDASQITALENTLLRIESDLVKLVDALIESPKIAHQNIYDKMEILQAQKSDAEIDLAKLRIASSIRLTEKEVLAWMQQFCDGDPLDESFQSRIIDTFINSVYLYDDRVAIFYNIKGGKQVSYIEISEEIEDTIPLESGSDLTLSAPPLIKTPIE